jgi:hypothetical protein
MPPLGGLNGNASNQIIYSPCNPALNVPSSPILQARWNTALTVVEFQTLVVPNAVRGFGQDRRERCLADHERIAPQVVAIQLDQAKGASPTVSYQGSGSMRGMFPPCLIARVAFPSPGQPPFAPDWLSAAFAYRIACPFDPFA